MSKNSFDSDEESLIIKPKKSVPQKKKYLIESEEEKENSEVSSVGSEEDDDEDEDDESSINSSTTKSEDEEESYVEKKANKEQKKQNVIEYEDEKYEDDEDEDDEESESSSNSNTTESNKTKSEDEEESYVEKKATNEQKKRYVIEDEEEESEDEDEGDEETESISNSNTTESNKTKSEDEEESYVETKATNEQKKRYVIEDEDEDQKSRSKNDSQIEVVNESYEDEDKENQVVDPISNKSDIINASPLQNSTRINFSSNERKKNFEDIDLPDVDFSVNKTPVGYREVVNSDEEETEESNEKVVSETFDSDSEKTNVVINDSVNIEPVRVIRGVEKPFVKETPPVLNRHEEPEIIELSDTETQSVKNAPAPGILSLSSKKMGDQRLLSSWSPNFMERTKPKVEVNRDVERQIKMMDLNDEALNAKLAALDNPKKNSMKDLKLQASVIRGPNAQITNRNLSFESQLKALSEGMFEVLESKPDPDESYEAIEMPTGLKVKLLTHQCYSMAWLKWRERNYPHGGILADDMGLGKTLTVLSYLRLCKDEREKRIREKQKEEEEEEEEEDDEDDENDVDTKKYLKKLKSRGKSSRGKSVSEKLKTLIILPASLLHQWQGEIKNKFEPDAFKFHVYHDANRKKYSYNLDDNDIVFTTYEIVSRELGTVDKDGEIANSDSPLAKIKWKRIILDEAHRIKNHTSKANKVICSLRAKYRIAITGTPIHNSLNDLYSLVKFVHFSPLDELTLWRYVFASETFTNKASANAVERQKRLNNWMTMLSEYVLLRRTKEDTIKGTNKRIVSLPEKQVEDVRIKLAPNEKMIYEKLFDESKAKVNKLLQSQQNRILGKVSAGAGGNYAEIFVYLLRLRQACCHMSLLSDCLDIGELQNVKMEAEGLDGLMENLNLKDGEVKNEASLESLEKIKKNVDLTKCLERSFMSSKMAKLLEMIEGILSESSDDKIIVVSQWTSMLALVAKNLRKREIEYYEIKGDIMLLRRNELVEAFNDKANNSTRILLLSLTAGGVGLNLIGANRMFLLDIHWNPALEQQCCDRIYRVGQTKDVRIFKFLCENTIEERIRQIQQFKIELAQKVCGASASGISGSAATAGSAKLTLKDFKLLFQDF